MSCTSRAPMSSSVLFGSNVSLQALACVAMLAFTSACAELAPVQPDAQTSSLSGAPTGAAVPQPATSEPASERVAAGNDVVGVYEGVAFTGLEAQQVLAYVNTVSLETLDIDAGIDIRAARSIVEARPIAHVATLAELYFVGEATLALLKSAAALWHGDLAGSLAVAAPAA
jgi:hypothetical protein